MIGRSDGAAGRLFCHFGYHLLRPKMGIALRQAHHKTAAMLIGTRAHIDAAMVHIHNHLTQVEPNARASQMNLARGMTLVEAVEDMLAVFGLDTYAVILNRQ